MKIGVTLAVMAAVVIGSMAVARAEKFSLGDGTYQLTLPEGWTRKPPRSNIVEHEFEAPAIEGDAQGGRATVMGAGGTVEDNITRWIGQFSQPDAADSREKTKIKKLTVKGQEITIVDLSGTYDDKPGPFTQAPSVQRAGYRLLGAIIVTKKDGKFTGNYYVKLVGPQRTIGKNEEAFTKMIEGLEAK